ncbi:MAG: RNA methyltransferase [Deltaproteobacteria bacterium]
MRLYMGLVHFPVYNKDHERIASALTTLDLHDLARLARTYAVKRFFIITPLEDQRSLAGRILNHWRRGYGAEYNPDRKEALRKVRVVGSLEEAMDVVRRGEGTPPMMIGTDASDTRERAISYEGLKRTIRNDEAVMLVFGTAWGLHEETMNAMDRILVPIKGLDGYNHLSVRTAAAIILDRLVGGTP